jgi:hypothetical protein
MLPQRKIQSLKSTALPSSNHMHLRSQLFLVYYHNHREIAKKILNADESEHPTKALVLR